MRLSQERRDQLKYRADNASRRTEVRPQLAGRYTFGSKSPGVGARGFVVVVSLPEGARLC
jgi:hypothetical protein